MQWNKMTQKLSEMVCFTEILVAVGEKFNFDNH